MFRKKDKYWDYRILLWSFKTPSAVFNVVPKRCPVNPAGLHSGCIKINPVVISGWVWGVFLQNLYKSHYSDTPGPNWGCEVYFVWPWGVGAWPAVWLCCLCVPTSLIHGVLLNHNVVSVADGDLFKGKTTLCACCGPCGGPGLRERAGSDDSSKPSGCLSRRPLCSDNMFIFYGKFKWLIFIWRCVAARQCFFTCGHILFVYRLEGDGISWRGRVVIKVYLLQASSVSRVSLHFSQILSYNTFIELALDFSAYCQHFQVDLFSWSDLRCQIPCVG